MDTQRKEFRIGVMVLAALVSLVFLTIFFGKQPMINFGDDYIIQVRFQRTPGIKRSSPVFKNGVQIGHVSKVELVDQDREVEITMRLDKRRRIYSNEECRIRQTMITGDASLEFVKRVNYTEKVEEIDPNIPLVGGTPSDLMNGFSNIEGDLTKAINSVADAAGNVGGFIDRINSAIGTAEEFQARQKKFEAIVEESRSTMASVRQLTDGANRFVGDPEIQQQVRKILNDLPEVIEKSRTLVGESTNFVQDARSLVERGNVSLDKLSSGLEKVAKLADTIVNLSDKIEGDVPEIVTAIKKSAVKLESLFDEITMIVEGVRNSDGTVKRLLRDPAVYEKILATLDNVEQITGEVNMMLQTDMKPIANNVKVLTDKAARDPSIFIRNLIRKEPPTKGLPFWGDERSCSAIVQPDDVIIEEEVVVEPIRTATIRAAHVSKRSPSPLPLPKLRVKQVTAEDTVPNEGRVISVDPRYPDVVNGAWIE